MAGRQKFLDGDPPGARAKLFDVVNRPIDPLLTSGRFRNDPGDSAAMSGDDERLSFLHLIEELRKMDFGLRSLNFPHCGRL